jgi:hypothetical protein
MSRIMSHIMCVNRAVYIIEVLSHVVAYLTYNLDKLNFGIIAKVIVNHISDVRYRFFFFFNTIKLCFNDKFNILIRKVKR